MLKFFKLLLLGMAFLAGLLIVILGELPGHSLFWLEAQNSGHILAFGLLSLAALLLVRSIRWFKEHNHAWSYLVAAILSLIAGIIVEFIQLNIGRDSETLDVLNDAVGVLSFLGIYALFDPALKSFRNNEGRRLIFAISGISLLLLLVGMSPFITLTSSYFQRNAAFPKLIDFNKRWPLAFMTTQDAVLQIINAPDQLQLNDQKLVGRITLYPAKYPGFSLREPVSDWSSFSYLSFTIYSKHVQQKTLSLRINDRQHNQQYDDRFNTSLELTPGKNQFRIPLDKVRSGPVNRELDLHSIAKLVLFAVEPDQPVQFYLSNLNLE